MPIVLGRCCYILCTQSWHLRTDVLRTKLLHFPHSNPTNPPKASVNTNPFHVLTNSTFYYNGNPFLLFIWKYSNYGISTARGRRGYGKHQFAHPIIGNDENRKSEIYSSMNFKFKINMVLLLLIVFKAVSFCDHITFNSFFSSFCMESQEVSQLLIGIHHLGNQLTETSPIYFIIYPIILSINLNMKVLWL